MWPQVEWRDWMEDLDHLRGPAPVWVRPAGLGSLGSDSYFMEPYRVRAPHRVHIGDGVGIGERSVLSVIDEYKGVRYDGLLRIGDGCSIAPDFFVQAAGEIEIGPRVGISARVFICDSARDYSDPTVPAVEMPIDEPRPVRIGEGTVIGLGAMIMPGVTIGERAAIGAGTFVTRDIPPRCVALGNPARIIRSWDEKSGQWIAGPPCD